MKNILIALFSLSSSVLQGQSTDVTYYSYNEFGVFEVTQRNADFYIKRSSPAITEINGQISAFYLDGSPYGHLNFWQSKINGNFKLLHKNGQPKLQGMMINGNRAGDITEWYENGQMKAQYQYIRKPEKPEELIIKINNHWDVKGSQEVKDGNGTFTSYHDNKQIAVQGKCKNGLKSGSWMSFESDGAPIYKEKYNNGSFVSGTSYNSRGKRSKYKQILVKASFPEGNTGWVQFLKGNLKYPAKAVKDKTQGAVYLAFVVDKNGGIAYPKVIKGVSPECDREALRVIKKSPRWTPGTLRGQEVNSQIRLSIVFKMI